MKTTDMHNFTPYSSIIGGILIGMAAVMLMAFNGRIAGISGISASALTGKAGDRLWRITFVAGLIAGPLLLMWVSGNELAFVQVTSLPMIIVAGLLVGFGTQLGSGCTSGHGVCGISRLSARSITATVVFMAAGVATVAIVRAMSGTLS